MPQFYYNFIVGGSEDFSLQWSGWREETGRKIAHVFHSQCKVLHRVFVK